MIINEAYLNGGSANATYKNKFVELYNPTSADISLDRLVLAVPLGHRAGGAHRAGRPFRHHQGQ